MTPMAEIPTNTAMPGVTPRHIINQNFAVTSTMPLMTQNPAPLEPMETITGQPGTGEAMPMTSGAPLWEKGGGSPVIG